MFQNNNLLSPSLVVPGILGDITFLPSPCGRPKGIVVIQASVRLSVIFVMRILVHSNLGNLKKSYLIIPV